MSFIFYLFCRLLEFVPRFIMKNVLELRSEFGATLKTLRKERGLSQRRLQEVSGVMYTTISSIERAERSVGAEMAVRLAEGLGLEGVDLDRFLLQAAATRRKDRLCSYSRALEPEILNFLPRVLANAGVNLGAIERSEVRSTVCGVGEYPEMLSRLQGAYDRVIGAVAGRNNGEFLLVDASGQRLLCTLLIVPIL